MIERFKNWVKQRFSAVDSPPPHHLRKTGAHAAMRPKTQATVQAVDRHVKIKKAVAGQIEDAGPGKNVLIRNKYVREDTGTHETLKILDDSLVDSGEEAGIDPYNTGGFDRSKNWNTRFRK